MVAAFTFVSNHRHNAPTPFEECFEILGEAHNENVFGDSSAWLPPERLRADLCGERNQERWPRKYNARVHERSRRLEIEPL
jgi:hypothetical protein